ncbi:hypothetical protein [Arthrobacter castelli]|uniref:hypothetical protein n=1 Tax=Arthrobacter castelli TaxID=271431 RepID=UPI000411512E|nr:hypothetical protein [Arthrobacter castelli]
MPNESLTDEQIDSLIHSNFRAFQVFLRGVGSGYTQGLADAQLSQEEQAQLAVRLFQAAQEDEEEIHKQIKHDVQWFDVERARQESTTEYGSEAAA